MKNRILKMLAFALLVLASTMTYAGGSEIPWCPISCPSSGASR